MPQKAVDMRGWRGVALVGGILTALGCIVYPAMIDPYLHPEKWRNIQKSTGSDVAQNQERPASLKPWTDPFDRKKQ